MSFLVLQGSVATQDEVVSFVTPM